MLSRGKITGRVLALLLILSTLYLSACTPVGDEARTKEPEQSVTLALLLPQSHYKDFLQQALEQFMLENPGIIIDAQIIPDNQWANLVKRKIAVGETPDLIRIDRGLLIDVGVENFVLFDDSAPWYDRVLAEQLRSKQVDGKLYGLPVGSISSIGIVYNRSLFNRYDVPVPKTMAQLESACQAFLQEGVVPLYASDKDAWTAGLGFTAAAPQAVPEETWAKIKAGQLKWSQVPEFESILNDFAAFRSKGYTNADYLKATYASAVSSMAQGNTAMYISGQFFLQDVLKENPSLDIMITAVPYREGVLTIIDGPGMFSVFQSSAHIEEAKIFLDWFSQPDNMDVFNAGWGHMAVFKDQHLKLHPWQQELYDEYISKGNTVPQLDDIISGIDMNDLWSCQQELYSGRLTAHQVLEHWDISFRRQLDAKDIPGW